MIFRLDNKSVVVTGGASGIGLAISELFAQQGAIVHILEVNLEVANQVVQGIEEKGGKAFAYTCDISQQADIQAVYAKIGKIDILVNNAGVAHIGTAESTSEADFDRVYQVNVKGAYNCIHLLIPKMKQDGGGVILNMASVAASLGLANRFAYSMSKSAIKSMTFTTAKDFIQDNIRCNCISPARVHTPFVDGFLAKNYPGQEAEMFEKLSKSQPIGRMAKPEEVAYLALYLCSNEASFVTGCDYPIDGGFIHLNT